MGLRTSLVNIMISCRRRKICKETKKNLDEDLEGISMELEDYVKEREVSRGKCNNTPLTPVYFIIIHNLIL